MVADPSGVREEPSWPRPQPCRDPVADPGLWAVEIRAWLPRRRSWQARECDRDPEWDRRCWRQTETLCRLRLRLSTPADRARFQVRARPWCRHLLPFKAQAESAESGVRIPLPAWARRE